MTNDNDYNLFCLRCGHKWIKRTAQPMLCPNCMSRYWNKSRKSKVIIPMNDENITNIVYQKDTATDNEIQSLSNPIEEPEVSQPKRKFNPFRLGGLSLP